MLCVGHAEAFRNAADAGEALVGPRFTPDRPAAEPGEKAIRVRALDDQFAMIAREAAGDGLITVADDTPVAFEIVEQPTFEFGFDLGLPVFSAIRLDQRRDHAIGAGEHKECDREFAVLLHAFRQRPLS
jgi:hypothetical protein